MKVQAHSPSSGTTSNLSWSQWVGSFIKFVLKAYELFFLEVVLSLILLTYKPKSARCLIGPSNVFFWANISKYWKIFVFPLSGDEGSHIPYHKLCICPRASYHPLITTSHFPLTRYIKEILFSIFLILRDIDTLVLLSWHIYSPKISVVLL